METTNTFDIIQTVADGNTDVIDILSIFSKPYEAIVESSMFHSMFTALQAVGIALMLLYFFIDLEEVALRQNFTLETFVKNLVKFVVGLIVILNVGPLMDWIHEFGAAVLRDVISTPGALHLTPSFKNAKDTANQILHHSSQTESLYKWVMTAIVYVFKFLTSCVLWVVAIKRAIELGLYYVFSPIIYADVFSNGLTGVVQKVKPVIGLYLQLPYVLLLLSLGNVLIDSSTAVVTTTSSILLTFIVLKAILSAVSKSRDELERFFGS